MRAPQFLYHGLSVLFALLMAGCSSDGPAEPTDDPGSLSLSSPPTVISEGAFPPQQTYTDLCWVGEREFVVVGEKGMVAHNREGRWEALPPAPTTDRLEGVTGTGADDLTAVSRDGSIFHYDGTMWRRQDPGVSAQLTDVCLAADGSAWAVGAGGTILRRLSGTGRWEDLSDPGLTDDPLQSVSAALSGEVYMAGAATLIEWHPQRGFNRSPADFGLVFFWSIWASGPDDVWAGGSQGALWHFDGQAWDRHTVAGISQIQSIVGFGNPASEIYVVGTSGSGTAAHRFDGVQSTDLEPPSDRALLAARRSQHDEFVAVGRNGNVLHYDRSTRQWRDLVTGVTRTRLVDVWLDRGGEGFAVDLEGGIWHRFPDGTWEFSHRFDAGLYGVWGSGIDDVYVCGASGSQGLLARFDGSVWSEIDTGLSSPPLDAVHGTGPSDVYVGGGSATLFRFDGEHWVDLSGDLRQGFRETASVGAVHAFAGGELVVVGDSDVSFFDGIAWRELEVNGPFGFYSIWGSAADDFFVCGDDGTLLRWRDLEMEDLTFPIDGSLEAVMGHTPNDVVAVGSDGTILHFDGESVFRLETSFATSIRGLARADGLRVAVGLGGLVLELRDGVGD